MTTTTDIQTPDDFGVARILNNWREFVSKTDMHPPRVLPNNVRPSVTMRINDRSYYMAQAAYFNALADYGIEVPPVFLMCVLSGRDILTLARKEA